MLMPKIVIADVSDPHTTLGTFFAMIIGFVSMVIAGFAVEESLTEAVLYVDVTHKVENPGTNGFLA